MNEKNWENDGRESEREMRKTEKSKKDYRFILITLFIFFKNMYK